MAGLTNDTKVRLMTMIESGRLAQAEAVLLPMVGRKPDAESCSLLALVAFQRGDPQRAIFHATRAAALAPSDPEITARLVDLLSMGGKANEAVRTAERAIDRLGRQGRLVLAMSEALIVLGRPQEALAAAEEALAAGEDPRTCELAVGKALEALGRNREAVGRLRRIGALTELPNIYSSENDLASAVQLAEQALESAPDDGALLWDYTSLLNYMDDRSAEQVFRAHVRLGSVIGANLDPGPPSWSMSAEPDRKLRIGIVSPDLRQHAVVSFLRPLLEGYDRESWHVTAYSVCAAEDAISRDLRGLCDRWVHLCRPHPGEVVHRTRSDRIDVAIDLAGYSLGQPISAFAARCAPVQITYLGYANTTGIPGMDARIVDSLTDPPGSDALATERLLRIDPCFLCYRPILDAPEAPRSRADGVVFGSFNHARKITPTTVRIWAAAVQAVPGARLVLKSVSLKSEETRRDMLDRFARAGLEPERITILSPAPGFREHLESYQHFDIALDPYPYHGTTTTCEAMWMGVPTITLAGDRHLARVGVSLMNAVGLGDLVAKSEAEFVEIARRLAADRARVTAWRSTGPGGLRAAMLASPLCDQKAFCLRFQGAVREVWRDWCRGRTKSG